MYCKQFLWVRLLRNGACECSVDGGIDRRSPAVQSWLLVCCIYIYSYNDFNGEYLFFRLFDNLYPKSLTIIVTRLPMPHRHNNPKLILCMYPISRYLQIRISCRKKLIWSKSLRRCTFLICKFIFWFTCK